MSRSSCLYCQFGELQSVIDFGPQAMTNRFLQPFGNDDYRHPLRIGQCGGCGVVQLIDLPPVDQVRPRLDWITYNEPERHLDDTAVRMTRLTGINPKSVVRGITYKEDTTFARLNRLGFANTKRLDSSGDLGIADPTAGLETIQSRITPKWAEKFAGAERADLLIVRHILEHAHSPREFLEAVAKLVRPNGHVVFEVPDCTRSMQEFDYSMPWEEHVAYFTPDTYRRALENNGWSVESVVTYEYSHENSLVAFCRPPQTSKVVAESPAIESEFRMVRAYGEAFARVKAECRRYLESFRAENGPIAVLGAGHLTAMFVNVFEIADLIEFVVDDDARKQGLLMPGSRLRILPSACLVDEQIKLCLLSVNPEVEARVREKNRNFAAVGGTMLSIFPGNAHPIPIATVV